jgi:shikimate dehydrogenase
LERLLSTPGVPEYGLIGYPLSHSFSPSYFEGKFAQEGIRATYTAFELRDINELPELVRSHPDLVGLNVTTPHKQDVIQFLSGLSDDAGDIGAVNCISIRHGKLLGYNTDWIGFRDSLIPLLKPQHTAALVLGGGGASLAIAYALRALQIPFMQVSRTSRAGSVAYDALTTDIIASHKLIVNTTTLGTMGEGLPPIPYRGISSEHLLYDLVYNPEITPFLAEGAQREAQVCNGLRMLHRQAEASWDIWQRGAA